jgi:putative tricarboxylic transport membrane protein
MAEDVNTSGEKLHAGIEPHTNHVVGGLTIVVLALFFALATFAVSEPKVMFSIGSFPVSSVMVPRVLALLVAATGVAVAAGFIPVRGPREFYGGLVLILLAVLALSASADLPGQRGFAFGPGTAPRLFALILAALGVAVAAVGALTDGPAIERYKIYGPSLVLVGIMLFASLIRPFGLMIATYIAFVASAMGSKEMRWVETLIAAAAMTLFCYVLFVVLLKLPFQLWPDSVSGAFAILWGQFEDIVIQSGVILKKFWPF